MSRNIASTNCCKIGGLRNSQRGGNLKKGEVNFERGVPTPLGTMVFGIDSSYLHFIFKSGFLKLSPFAYLDPAYSIFKVFPPTCYYLDLSFIRHYRVKGGGTHSVPPFKRGGANFENLKKG